MTKTVRFLLLLMPVMGAGVPMQAMSEAPPYPIKESGFRAAREGTPIWLDNNRVIFSGYEVKKDGQARLSDRVTDYKAELFVWDTAENKVTKYDLSEGAARLCVHDTYRSYMRVISQQPKIIKLVEGKIGEETERPLPEKYWFNPLSCRYYDTRPYWAGEGRETEPLLEEHGYLDWGVTLSPSTQDVYHKNTPIAFYPRGAKEGISLPIGRREVWRTGIYYTTFKNAYLLSAVTYIDPITGRENAVGVWPKGVPVLFWWLTPDGKVTKVEIPYIPLLRGGVSHLYPTRTGIFLPFNVRDPGEAGGYLVQDQQVKKLIAGMLWKMAVSSDGCKIAMVHDPNDQNPVIHRVTLKMLDVCNGGSHVN